MLKYRTPLVEDMNRLKGTCLENMVLRITIIIIARCWVAILLVVEEDFSTSTTRKQKVNRLSLFLSQILEEPPSRVRPLGALQQFGVVFENRTIVIKNIWIYFLSQIGTYI